MNFLSVFIGLFIAAEWKAYWLTSRDPPSDKFMSTIGSIGSVFNGMRFVWSWMLDHMPYRTVYGILLAAEVCIGVTMPLVVNQKWLYTLWICAGYLCLGGHFTLLPNQFKNVFGDQATRLYSICFSFSGISGICEIVIQLYVLTDNNLTLFFYIYSLLAAVSLVLLVFWYDPTPYKRQ